MKTIAIIDDDIHIGDMLVEVLTQEGYAVLRAYSGTEALYILSQNKPDLVLLDLMLPGLSGEEVLPHIENIPVIVISAKVDVQDKVNLLLGGAADYMTKPFDTKELLARITVQLRKAEQHGETKSLSVGDLVLDIEKSQAQEKAAVSIETLLGDAPETLTIWQKLKRAIRRLIKKNNFFELNDFWLVSEHGYPKNQMICIYIWEDKNGQLAWQTGIYNQKLEQFSVRYGQTVYSINQNKVIAWKKMSAEAVAIEIQSHDGK